MSLSLILYLPRNDYGIPAGVYTLNKLVELLRAHKCNPAAVQFIADMMEV